MPDSCAKAFAPTMALLGCTGNPVMLDTIFDAATICVASMRVVHGNTSLRVRTAITISSSEAFPARHSSPRKASWPPQDRDHCAVHRPDGPIGIRNPLAQGVDQRAKLPRHRV